MRSRNRAGRAVVRTISALAVTGAVALAGVAASSAAGAATIADSTATIDPTPTNVYYTSYWGGDVAPDTTEFDVTLPPERQQFLDIPMTWTMIGEDDVLISQGPIPGGADSFVAPVPAGSSLPRTIAISDADADPSVSIAMTILVGPGPSSSLPTSVIDLSTQNGVRSDVWWFEPTAPVVSVDLAGTVTLVAPGPWFTDGLDADWVDTRVGSVTFGQKGIPSSQTDVEYEVSADGTTFTVRGLDALPADAWEGQPAVAVSISSASGISRFRNANLTVPVQLASPTPTPTPTPTPSASVVPTDGGSGATLAATGASDILPLGAAGTLLAAIGTVALATRRRAATR